MSAPKPAGKYCALPRVADRQYAEGLAPGRLSAIRETSKKWVNGTVLHFHFLQKGAVANWGGSEAQCAAVRSAFAKWKELKIGLSFEEVAAAEDAEIRVAFDWDDGSWSYVGRDCIDLVKNHKKPTTNFGWDLTDAYGGDTALHEIGHSMGLDHEHQNPIAGIVWNEARVYESLGGPPNNWSHDQTFYNVIRKLDPSTVQGSKWDPNSIMEYAFEAGLIDKPDRYRDGLTPAGGLSARDREWILRFYPTLDASSYRLIQPLASVQVAAKDGEQLNFSLQPGETRKYVIQTFGEIDSNLVVFEDRSGKFVYLAGADDAGTSSNAVLEQRLERGRKYVIRLRVVHSAGTGALMVS